MTGAESPLVALVVARDLVAVQDALQRAGLGEAGVGPAPTPSLPHVAVALPDTAARHALTRLATASGWLVLLAPPQSYRRAATLLVVATRLPLSRRVLHVNELLVYQVLAATSDEEQEALVTEVLGPVLELPAAAAGRLLTTLESLHWNEGSAKGTARVLGLHSKTVLNRIRRFEALTGLCLDRPPDRLRADVALYVLRMRGRLARVETARPPAVAPGQVMSPGRNGGMLQTARVAVAAGPR